MNPYMIGCGKIFPKTNKQGIFFVNAVAMNNLLTRNPIIQAGNFQLEKFSAEHMLRYDNLIFDLLNLFNEDNTVRYVPSRRLESAAEAETYLQMLILKSAHSDQVYFLSDQSTRQVLGVVQIVSPETAKRHYQLAKYPHFIEFYLSKRIQAKGLMSELLPEFIIKLNDQGITSIGAVADRKNLKACQVLTKTGFKNLGIFDHKQDLYLYE